MLGQDEVVVQNILKLQDGTFKYVVKNDGTEAIVSGDELRPPAPLSAMQSGAMTIFEKCLNAINAHPSPIVGNFQSTRCYEAEYMPYEEMESVYGDAAASIWEKSTPPRTSPRALLCCAPSWTLSSTAPRSLGAKQRRRWRGCGRRWLRMPGRCVPVASSSLRCRPTRSASDLGGKLQAAWWRTYLAQQDGRYDPTKDAILAFDYCKGLPPPEIFFAVTEGVNQMPTAIKDRSGKGTVSTCIGNGCFKCIVTCNAAPTYNHYKHTAPDRIKVSLLMSPRPPFRSIASNALML